MFLKVFFSSHLKTNSGTFIEFGYLSFDQFFLVWALRIGSGKKNGQTDFCFQKSRVSRGIKNPYTMFIIVRKQFPNVTTRNQCDNLAVFFY